MDGWIAETALACERKFTLPEMPPVPLTLEGSCMLHQIFRFDWKGWRALSPAERERIAKAAEAKLKEICSGPAEGAADQSALFSQLGHKGDLMLVHMRPTVGALNQVELHLAQMELYDYLELSYSYVSVVELGLYESTAKTYWALAEKQVVPFSAEWDSSIKETIQRQTTAMATRLFPSFPETTYICFYPMDRKRGEAVNWYQESMADRQRMMHEHGMIGRRYADDVRQIISGSIGWDDWEWGVDLFANDPVVFKKLIYEMRFDEVSAKYALFGSFYLGVRLPVERLGSWLAGSL